MAQILTKVRNPYNLINALASAPRISEQLSEHIDSTNKVINPLLEEAIASLSSRNSQLAESLKVSLVTKRDYDRAWFIRVGFETVSEHWEKALHIMTAAELCYASVVILDDIADQGIMRFGRPTLYRTIGTDAAMYVAEMLRALATGQLLRSIDGVELSPETLCEILRRNERTLCDINYGQYLDVTSAGKRPESFKDDDCLRLIHFTTGVDISNCLATGALIGGLQNSALPLLEDIGSLIGLIMQIRDDMLDYADSPDEIEKTPGRDFARMRMKLPYIVAHRFACEEDRVFLELAAKEPNPSNWGNIRRIVLSGTAVSYIRDLAMALQSQLDSLVRQAQIRTQSKVIIESFYNEILSPGWQPNDFFGPSQTVDT